jgi:lysophospholipase L1-like esterase
MGSRPILPPVSISTTISRARTTTDKKETAMRSLWSLLSLLVAAVTLTSCSGEIMTLRKGERIIFLGDSITQQGVEPTGYVTLIRNELSARHPDLGIEFLGAGISGNKVTDLQNRLSKDVIEKKPTIVVIYIGINDVWHWTMPNHQGSTKEQFEGGLREIIARIQYSGAEVVLCTPSIIGERRDSTNAQDSTLNAYCEISRRVAKSLGTRMCDLRHAFIGYLSQHNPENKEKGILTVDGVHLNGEGNKLVANELLRFLGGHQ